MNNYSDKQRELQFVFKNYAEAGRNGYFPERYWLKRNRTIDKVSAESARGCTQRIVVQCVRFGMMVFMRLIMGVSFVLAIRVLLVLVMAMFLLVMFLLVLILLVVLFLVMIYYLVLLRLFQLVVLRLLILHLIYITTPLPTPSLLYEAHRDKIIVLSLCQMIS